MFCLEGISCRNLPERIFPIVFAQKGFPYSVSPKMGFPIGFCPKGVPIVFLPKGFSYSVLPKIIACLCGRVSGEGGVTPELQNRCAGALPGVLSQVS